MKKIILLICLCFLSLDISAQNKVVFGEIVELNPLSKKVKVIIDIGQKRDKGLVQQKLVDKDGELMVFNSKIDALNYMTSLGWEFVQAYTVVKGSSANGTGSTKSEIHWLLCKTVKAETYPYDGLRTKEEL